MRTRLAATAVTAAALLCLAACSSGGNDKAAAPSSSDTAGVPAATSPAGTAIPSSTASLPAAPNAVVRAGYLAALKAVDPALAADPDQSVRTGRTQCAQLDSDPETADHVAAERFSTPGHPLTDAQGKLIDVALHTTLCPSH